MTEKNKNIEKSERKTTEMGKNTENNYVWYLYAYIMYTAENACIWQGIISIMYKEHLDKYNKTTL